MRAKLICLLLILLSAHQAFSKEEVCIKNGRQYFIELSQQLSLNPLEFIGTFTSQIANLPKNGSMKEYANGLPAYLGIADPICSRFNRNNSIFSSDDSFSTYLDSANVDFLPLVDLTQRLVGRTPTQEEKDLYLSLGDSPLKIYTSCMVIAGSEEFIRLPGKCIGQYNQEEKNEK